MFFGRMRVALDHLYARVSEHRGESNQINPGHGSASRPRMAKVIESKVWNRTLVCFRSNAVDSRVHENKLNCQIPYGRRGIADIIRLLAQTLPALLG